MGNQPSSNKTQLIRKYKPHQWIKIEDENSYQIWQNTQNLNIYDLYRMDHDLPKHHKQVQKYEFRKMHHMHLVPPQCLLKMQDSLMCSQPYSSLLVLEHSEYRLRNIPRKLTLQESLYVLLTSASGYNILNSFQGPIIPNQDLISFNTNGQCKVWINQNFSQNQPTQTNQHTSIEEQRTNLKNRKEQLSVKDYQKIEQLLKNCAQSLVQCVQKHTHQRYPINLREKLYSAVSFFQLINLIENFCEEKRIKIPLNLQFTRIIPQTNFASPQLNKYGSHTEQILSHNNTSNISINQSNIGLRDSQNLSSNLMSSQAIWKSKNPNDLSSLNGSQHQIGSPKSPVPFTKQNNTIIIKYIPKIQSNNQVSSFTEIQNLNIENPNQLSEINVGQNEFMNNDEQNSNVDQSDRHSVHQKLNQIEDVYEEYQHHQNNQNSSFSPLNNNQNLEKASPNIRQYQRFTQKEQAIQQNSNFSGYPKQQNSNSYHQNNQVGYSYRIKNSLQKSNQQNNEINQLRNTQEVNTLEEQFNKFSQKNNASKIIQNSGKNNQIIENSHHSDQNQIYQDQNYDIVPDIVQIKPTVQVKNNINSDSQQERYQWSKRYQAKTPQDIEKYIQQKYKDYLGSNTENQINSKHVQQKKYNSYNTKSDSYATKYDQHSLNIDSKKYSEKELQNDKYQKGQIYSKNTYNPQFNSMNNQHSTQIYKKRKSSKSINYQNQFSYIDEKYNIYVKKNNSYLPSQSKIESQNKISSKNISDRRDSDNLDMISRITTKPLHENQFRQQVIYKANIYTNEQNKNESPQFGNSLSKNSLHSKRSEKRISYESLRQLIWK